VKKTRQSAQPEGTQTIDASAFLAGAHHMHDGNNPPAPSPREVACRIDEELKSCHKLVNEYRGLLRGWLKKKPPTGD
jgi:hypothetical protein